jgi:hypothetical protein
MELWAGARQQLAPKMPPLAIPLGGEEAAWLTRCPGVRMSRKWAPVSVLVATNLCGVIARRILAQGIAGRPGIAGLSVLTVDRLAELIAAPALTVDGRRPATSPVIAAAWRRALAEDPGVFGPVMAHPATLQALTAAHRELREVAEGELDAIAGCGEPIASDLTRLHRRVTGLLATDWYDTTDRPVNGTSRQNAGIWHFLSPRSSAKVQPDRGHVWPSHSRSRERPAAGEQQPATRRSARRGPQQDRPEVLLATGAQMSSTTTPTIAQSRDTLQISGNTTSATSADRGLAARRSASAKYVGCAGGVNAAGGPCHRQPGDLSARDSRNR